jgi:hypothetical protein
MGAGGLRESGGMVEYSSLFLLTFPGEFSIVRLALDNENLDIVRMYHFWTD